MHNNNHITNRSLKLKTNKKKLKKKSKKNFGAQNKLKRDTTPIIIIIIETKNVKRFLFAEERSM